LSKRSSVSSKPPSEKAFLVGVEIFQEPKLFSIQDSLDELAQLATTDGLEVVGDTYQKLNHPNSNTFIGPGKVEEIKSLANELEANVILFDGELSPRHQRELEEAFGTGIKIVDRTALILNIFAQHAQTREGILQVELAQNEYRLPRLTRAWTHLARQAGGGGGRTGNLGGVGLRGPGETQLEVDKREVRRRISFLNEEIEKIRGQRFQHRVQRKRAKLPVISIIGYTNAGKSTLLNQLAKANVYVADQLFATLDPTTRRVLLPGNHLALFSDTVGFIQKLPTQLIAAFRATLEEIKEADLLLHVVDITHPNALAQWKSVQETLHEIEAHNLPVVTILNKLDDLPNPNLAKKTLSEYPDAVAVSALTGEGIQELLDRIETILFEAFITVKVKLPYQNGQLISIFHEHGHVNKISYLNDSVSIQGSIPSRFLNLFIPYFSSASLKSK
jgi:GTP-binding protein HflX